MRLPDGEDPLYNDGHSLPRRPLMRRSPETSRSCDERARRADLLPTLKRCCGPANSSSPPRSRRRCRATRRTSSRKALPLKGLADAVNVTDGASARTHMAAPIAAAILVRHGIEPILQLACRDRNRIALQADLIGAAACGVHNLLCLTGDEPSAGDQPETKPVFDIDATALTAMARAIRDRGELPSGRKIGGKANFFLGAADMPIDPPPGWVPAKLAAKVAAGAAFAQTQFCMDAGVVRRYAQRLAETEATRGLSCSSGSPRCARPSRPAG